MTTKAPLIAKTSPQNKPPRRTELLNAFATTLHVYIIFILSFVAYVPFSPAFPKDTLDSGWMFAVNAAVAKGLVFGKDIIFTYGPYGSVSTGQFNPATGAMMFGGSALMAAAFGSILLCICSDYRRVFSITLALVMLLVESDTRFYALPLLALILIYLVSLPNTSPAAIPLSFGVKLTLGLTFLALGVQPLVKDTFGICALLVVLCACFLLCRRRRFLLALGTLGLYLAWLAALWVMAGQPIQYLPGFFAAQLPIVSGYSAAMSIAGPAWQILLYVASGTLLWVLGNLRLRADGDAGLVLAFGSAILLFLAFKEGFVRDDVHSFIAGGLLAVSGVAFALFRKTPIAICCCAIGLVSFVAFNHINFGFTLEFLQKPNAGMAAQAFADDIAVSSNIIVGDIGTKFQQAAVAIQTRIKNKDVFTAEYNARLAAIRSTYFMPAISGPTDIYSYGQSWILSSGLPWDPRPVIQSYSAYTPALAAEDARHLTGPDAPTNIFFAVQPIDDRLPSLEDGASWPALLTDYTATGLYDDDLLLHRRPAASITAPVPGPTIMAGTFRMGEMIPIPASTRPIWSTIDIQPTLLGRLAGLVFKPPHLNILYVFPNGQRQSFRYIAGMGQAGFLLSPLVQTTRDFTALSLPDATPYFAQKQPAYISLTAVHSQGLLWRSLFSMKLTSAAIPPQANARQLLFVPLQPSTPGSYPTSSSCWIDQINGSTVPQLSANTVNVGNFVRISGWAAISAKAGLPAAQTAITLTAPDGTQFAALAPPLPRPDVAAGYNEPALANTGFDVPIDLGGLSGHYMLGITLTGNGKSYQCWSKIPLNIAPH